MPTPPPLSQEQRRAAYEKALKLRRSRAFIKARLRERAWTFTEAWEEPVAQGMKVYDLLAALPGIGQAKALALLNEAGIPEKNTVRACGPKQTERLFNILRRS